MSCARQYRIRPMLRICAAVSLVIWIFAFTFCSSECLIGHSDADHTEQASAANGQHDSDKHDTHDDSFCISLHSFAPCSTSTVLVKPDFHLAYTLDFVSTARFVATDETETPRFRHARWREWVFTPEVCLGPAFHSLAPPFVA